LTVFRTKFILRLLLVGAVLLLGFRNICSELLKPPLNGDQFFACVRDYIQKFFESFFGSGEWRLRLSHNFKECTDGKSLSRHATALSHCFWGRPNSRSVHSCSDVLPFKRLNSPKGEKTMPSQSAKKPPQSETRTKENLNLPGWKAPSLADLLQRLSVNSANSSLKR
jgi:hypothetical protein